MAARHNIVPCNTAGSILGSLRSFFNFLLPQDHTLALLRLMGSADTQDEAAAGAVAGGKSKAKRLGASGKDQHDGVDFEEDVDGREAVGSLAAKLSELGRRLLQVRVDFQGNFW
jgi:hypothetical protein